MTIDANARMAAHTGTVGGLSPTSLTGTVGTGQVRHKDQAEVPVAAELLNFGAAGDGCEGESLV